MKLSPIMKTLFCKNQLDHFLVAENNKYHYFQVSLAKITKSYHAAFWIMFGFKYFIQLELNYNLTGNPSFLLS